MAAIVNCAEKNYLEKEIHDCVFVLTDLSKRAAAAKQGAPNEVAEVETLKDEISAAKVRLSTLRGCLEVHMETHSCRI